MPRSLALLSACLLAGAVSAMVAQTTTDPQPATPPTAIPAPSFRLHSGPADPTRRFTGAPITLKNSMVAEQNTCLKLRSYRFERGAGKTGKTGAPAFAEYTDCQPGATFGLRYTLATPERPADAR